eukprot:m.197055 g.197055  ORF g.197055 m.197055 type:complete len:1598 (+) comp21847_c0_seq1:34-4827(+)
MSKRTGNLGAPALPPDWSESGEELGADSSGSEASSSHGGSSSGSRSGSSESGSSQSRSRSDSFSGSSNSSSDGTYSDEKEESDVFGAASASGHSEPEAWARPARRSLSAGHNPDSLEQLQAQLASTARIRELVKLYGSGTALMQGPTRQQKLRRPLSGSAHRPRARSQGQPASTTYGHSRLYDQRPHMSHVLVRRNGVYERGETLHCCGCEDLLQQATQKLQLPFAAQRLFDSEGRELCSDMDLALQPKGAAIYVSTGEGFKNPLRAAASRSEGRRHRAPVLQREVTLGHTGQPPAAQSKHAAKHRVLVFPNGNGQDAVTVLMLSRRGRTTADVHAHLLETATQKLKLSPAGRRLYDIQGLELMPTGVVQGCVEELEPLLGRVRGPLWITQGEALNFEGPRSFLVLVDRALVARLHIIDALQQGASLAEASQGRQDVPSFLSRLPALNKMDFADMAQHQTVLVAARDCVRDLLGLLGQTEEHMLQGEPPLQYGQTVSKIKDTHRLVQSSAGLRLRVYPNGRSDSACSAAVHFNVRAAERGLSRAKDSRQLVLSQLLDACTRRLQLPPGRQGKLLFREDGSVVADVLSLRRDESLWLSCGEPFIATKTFCLGLTVNAVQLVLGPDGALFTVPTQRMLSAADVAWDSPEEIELEELRTDPLTTLVCGCCGKNTHTPSRCTADAAAAAAALDFSTAIPLSETDLVVSCPSAEGSEELLRPRLQAGADLEEVTVTATADQSAVTLSLSAFPGLVLAAGGADQSAFDYQSPVIAVVFAVRDTAAELAADQACAWRCGTDGTLRCVRYPQHVLTARPDADNGGRVALELCFLRDDQSLTPLQRWGFQSTNLSVAGSDVGDALFAASKLLWPVKSDGSLNRKVPWPLQGHLVYKAPWSAPQPTSDSVVALGLNFDALKFVVDQEDRLQAFTEKTFRGADFDWTRHRVVPHNKPHKALCSRCLQPVHTARLCPSPHSAPIRAPPHAACSVVRCGGQLLEAVPTIAEPAMGRSLDLSFAPCAGSNGNNDDGEDGHDEFTGCNFLCIASTQYPGLLLMAAAQRDSGAVHLCFGLDAATPAAQWTFNADGTVCNKAFPGLVLTAARTSNKELCSDFFAVQLCAVEGHPSVWQRWGIKSTAKAITNAPNQVSDPDFARSGLLWPCTEQGGINHGYAYPLGGQLLVCAPWNDAKSAGASTSSAANTTTSAAAAGKASFLASLSRPAAKSLRVVVYGDRDVSRARTVIVPDGAPEVQLNRFLDRCTRALGLAAAARTLYDEHNRRVHSLVNVASDSLLRVCTTTARPDKLAKASQPRNDAKTFKCIVHRNGQADPQEAVTIVCSLKNTLTPEQQLDVLLDKARARLRLPGSARQLYCATGTRVTSLTMAELQPCDGSLPQLWVSCGEPFVPGVYTPGSDQEKLQQLQQRLKDTKDTLRQNYDELKALAAARDPTGTESEQECSLQELVQEGKQEIQSLKKQIDALQRAVSKKAAAPTRPAASGRLATPAHATVKVHAFRNGEYSAGESGMDCWGRDMFDLLQNCTTRLGLTAARKLYTKDGTPITRFEDLSVNQIVIVSGGEPFLTAAQKRRQLKEKLRALNTGSAGSAKP